MTVTIYVQVSAFFTFQRTGRATAVYHSPNDLHKTECDVK